MCFVSSRFVCAYNSHKNWQACRRGGSNFTECFVLSLLAISMAILKNRKDPPTTPPTPTSTHTGLKVVVMQVYHCLAGAWNKASYCLCVLFYLLIWYMLTLWLSGVWAPSCLLKPHHQSVCAEVIACILCPGGGVQHVCGMESLGISGTYTIGFTKIAIYGDLLEQLLCTKYEKKKRIDYFFSDFQWLLLNTRSKAVVMQLIVLCNLCTNQVNQGHFGTHRRTRTHPYVHTTWVVFENYSILATWVEHFARELAARDGIWDCRQDLNSLAALDDDNQSATCSYSIKMLSTGRGIQTFLSAAFTTARSMSRASLPFCSLLTFSSLAFRTRVERTKRRETSWCHCGGKTSLTWLWWQLLNIWDGCWASQTLAEGQWEVSRRGWGGSSFELMWLNAWIGYRYKKSSVFVCK